MKTTGVITMVQREGKGRSCIRKQTRGGRGRASHLRRTVQDAVDEVDQLLHGANVLVGQEELLVGCVEDDHGGHRQLTEGGGEKEIEPLSSKCIIRQEQIAAQRYNSDKQSLYTQIGSFSPVGILQRFVFCVEEGRAAPRFPQRSATSIFYANSVELRGSEGLSRSHLKSPLQVVADKWNAGGPEESLFAFTLQRSQSVREEGQRSTDGSTETESVGCTASRKKELKSSG